MDKIKYNVDKIVPEPLSKKVIKGGLWVFALRIINRGLGFVRTIILARLLAPEDFGLLGIAMLTIATLETFFQTGFQQALIQKKENVESYLNTAWTVSVIRGAIIFCILLFSAPLISKFFNSPQATLVVRVIAIITLLSGFKNIGVVFFQKELMFNKQFYYEFSTTLMDLIVSISLAFILKNVWALVYGGVAASLVRFIMSYVLHPYRPLISFEKDKFRDLFRFGRWVLGSSMLIFFITKGDDIIVGKMFGITALGLYQMAYLISNLPATEITHVISQVTFPAYTKLQDDLPKLRQAYLEVLQFTTFLSFPIAGLLFVLAPDITRIFLGAKWMPMVPAMQILTLWGMIRSAGATTGPVFLSIGKPLWLTKVQFLNLIFLIALIYPLSARWEILGTSLAVLFATLIPVSVAFYMVIKHLNSTLSAFLKIILLPLLNTCVVVSLLLYSQKYFFINITLFNILFFVIILSLIYLGLTHIFDNLFGNRIYHIARRFLQLKSY